MNSLKESDKRVTVMEREHSNGDSDFFYRSLLNDPIQFNHSLIAIPL